MEDVSTYILCPFGLFSDIRSILRRFCIVYGYLVYCSRFGILLLQEKSGNPDKKP
jgi:hypothetical protein